MNPHEFDTLRSNWEAIRPNARFVARLFYTKLLLIDPSLAPLFLSHPQEQSQRLLRAVGIAVHGIGQPRILHPLLRMLGRHPAVRRMPASQFKAIGQALLWTLGIALGEAFDDTARRAWENLYRTVSDKLCEAPRETCGMVVAELRAAA